MQQQQHVGYDYARQITFEDAYSRSYDNESYYPDKSKSEDNSRCEQQQVPTVSSQSNTPHSTMRKQFPDSDYGQQSERLAYDKQIKVTDTAIQTALTYVSTPHKSYLHDDDYLASDYDSPTHTVLYKSNPSKTSSIAVQTVLSHTSSQGKSLLNDIPTNFPTKPSSHSKRYHQRSHSGECRWPGESSHYNNQHSNNAKPLIKERSIKISETSFSSSVPTLKEAKAHSSTGKLPQSSSLVDYQEGDQCIKIYETTSKTAFGYQHSITDETLKTSNLLAQIALPHTSQSYESLSTDDHAEILIKLPIRRSFV